MPNIVHVNLFPVYGYRDLFARVFVMLIGGDKRFLDSDDTWSICRVSAKAHLGTKNTDFLMTREEDVYNFWLDCIRWRSDRRWKKALSPNQKGDYEFLLGSVCLRQWNPDSRKDQADMEARLRST